MNKWILSSNKKFIYQEISGFLIKKDVDFIKPDPSCLICEYIVRDFNDAISIEMYKCCTTCRDEVVYPNLLKWKNGWLPSENEKNDIIKKHKSKPSYIIV